MAIFAKFCKYKWMVLSKKNLIFAQIKIKDELFIDRQYF